MQFKTYFANMENLVSLNIFPEEELNEKFTINQKLVFNNLRSLKNLHLGDVSFNCDAFSFENLAKVETLSMRSLCLCQCSKFEWKFKNVKNFKLRFVCNERERETC